MPSGRALVIAAAAAGVLVATSSPLAAQRTRPDVAAQQPEANTELAQLRQATEYENAGDLEAATRIIEGVLQVNPSSLTALLAYERLMNVQGRPGDALPAVDRLLEAQPGSVLGHQVRLRIVSRMDDNGALRAAISAWIRATPAMETPYREAALVWRERGDVRRALEVLEQGRSRIDLPDALALELGDAWAEAGDLRRAAAEWARAVGSDGRGFLLVQRRLQSRPDAGAAAIPYLVEQLGGGSRSPGRQRAAALLAIDAGLEARARALVAEVAGATTGPEREQVLVEAARRADGAGLYALAAWSYGELLRDRPDPSAGLAIRTRIAELALMAGDTALAADVYRQLENAAAAGSPQRREAMALRLQLTAREGDLAQAIAQLDSFRSEYPRAPELDGAAARLALRLLEDGDAAGAESVLAGVSGPHSARVRGRIRIRAGDVAGAREQLMAAAPLLHGQEATETIALVALLSRLSPGGAEFVAGAVAADPADRAAIIERAIEETRRLPAAERSAVLDFVAGMADASGLPEEADVLRGEIVERMPRSHEAPAAMLSLARRALQQATAGEVDDAAGEEARVLLERLILEYPRSALAPQARRELERLQERSSRP